MSQSVGSEVSLWSTPGFRPLWTSTASSSFGTALSAGVISLVAILLLDASTAQVSLLIAIGGATAAVLSVPLSPLIESRSKRPVMIVSDVLRASIVAALPVLIWLDVLAFWQLCVAAVGLTGLGITFAAANTSHFRDLLPEKYWGRAYAEFETLTWTTAAVVTPLGGVLTTLFGPTVALSVNAACFALSGFALYCIRTPEPAPPKCDLTSGWARSVALGWTYIHAAPALRGLFWNAMVFGGCITLTAPLLAVLVLRDLGLSPWSYSLILGLPALGGVLGSRLAMPCLARWGLRRVLLVAGCLRSIWLVLIPLSPSSTAGFYVILTAELMLMLSAGVYNPVFSAYRVKLVDRSVLSRVGAAWPITAKSIQPLFVLAGGALASLVGVRGALAAAAVALIASTLLLPWRHVPHTLEDADLSKIGT
ncbi:MFS transporter [Pseudokineococcus sp. 1T1Z-3]|uniref:MFS transporter n=1 Tax=Pseudokineococcus sp. 1T1Z-3 TaxID=3132745 RepID=UPI0030A6F1DE